MKIYLAGPFFDESSKEVIKKLESLLENLGHIVYSPSRDGGILKKDAPHNERVKIFSQNIGAIKWCDCIVAIIDGFDPGTIWEFGYAYGINKPIITYSAKNYGLNVMLAEASRCHTKSYEELGDSLKGISKIWIGDVQ